MWNYYKDELTDEANDINGPYRNVINSKSFKYKTGIRGSTYNISFENENDRTSFSKHYVPKVEIKDFNVLIDGKPFFEIPVKNKEEAYEAII